MSVKDAPEVVSFEGECGLNDTCSGQASMQHVLHSRYIVVTDYALQRAKKTTNEHDTSLS